MERRALDRDILTHRKSTLRGPSILMALASIESERQLQISSMKRACPMPTVIVLVRVWGWSYLPSVPKARPQLGAPQRVGSSGCSRDLTISILFS